MHTITAVSLWHIDITRLLVSSFEIRFPAFNAANSNCCLFWGVSAFTLLFSRRNSCSTWFKSGDRRLPFLCPYKLLDWTSRVFWVIVLMQYEALPNSFIHLFIHFPMNLEAFSWWQDLVGKMVLYPSKLILLLSSYIKSSVKLSGPVPETACMPCHSTTSTMLYSRGCMLGIFCSSLFFSTFLLSNHLDKGSSLSHWSMNTVPKLFSLLTFVFFCKL